jgi:hypothetical protein
VQNVLEPRMLARGRRQRPDFEATRLIGRAL